MGATPSGRGTSQSFALRVRVSPDLRWHYPLSVFDLLTPAGTSVGDVLKLLALPAEAVAVRVNGSAQPPDRVLQEGDELEIAPAGDGGDRDDFCDVPDRRVPSGP